MIAHYREGVWARWIVGRSISPEPYSRVSVLLCFWLVVNTETIAGREHVFPYGRFSVFLSSRGSAWKARSMATLEGFCEDAAEPLGQKTA